MSRQEVITNANSQGVILDFYNNSTNQFGKTADFDLNKALKIIKNDPVVKGAIISLCDKVLETPFQAVGRDGKSKEKEAQQKLEDLRMRALTRKVVFNLLLYGNAFVEIVKKNKKVTDLNVLESNHMEIQAKENGDVTGYIQNVPGEKGLIKFSKDKVVHIKLTDITTNTWGEVDIQSIYDTVLLKDSVRNWILWFFKTNQSRGFYNIKNASEQKVKTFLSMLKANEKDLTKPVIAQGEVEYQLLRTFADEGKSMNDVLLWANTEILALLQVPPITMGFPDMSGRSNSSEQQKALHTKVYSIQQILEDAYTYELLPAIGFPKVKFTFGALDDSMMKQKMEVVVMMKNAGFTNEAIEEWMKSEGVFFETTDIFNKPEDFGLPGGNSVTGQDEDAPSRQRKGEGEANEQQDEVTTREDQLVANAEVPATDEEVVDQYAEVMGLKNE
jgi:phage portal protein BeeE